MYHQRISILLALFVYINYTIYMKTLSRGKGYKVKYIKFNGKRIKVVQVARQDLK